MALQEIASKYEELTQELPPELEEMAREHKAFQRPRRLKSAEELWEVVML